MGLRAPLNFRKNKLIKGGYNDKSKSKSWHLLETVLSHLKGKHSFEFRV